MRTILEKKNFKLFNQALSNNGFTLIEIIVVITIISLMMLTATVGLMRWRPSFELKSASESFYVNLQRARVHAIKNNVDVNFTITAAATCPGGRYVFSEAGGGNIVDETIDGNNCLQLTNVAAGGLYTSRGIANNTPTVSVTFMNVDIAGAGKPIYTVTQSAAGSIQTIKTIRP